MTEEDRIRVLVVDDSLVAREMLAQILATDSSIEVVGFARDGREAADAVAHLRPDLVTMDIHMPRMDGLEATERIMAYTPTPILVVSSSVHGEGMGRAFDALTFGALEVIKKPEPRDWADLEHIGREVIRRVKVLSKVKVITHIGGRRPRKTSGVPVPPHAEKPGGRSLVAVGSSTGGPSALLEILGRLPGDLPAPIVIAQHIADGFVPGLVSWLDSGSEMTVREAEEGGRVHEGCAYIAPTSINLEMDNEVMRFSTPQKDQLYVPCADTLFDSVARGFGRQAVGVILTGMGADGAAGLKRMRDAGAATIAQDEKTSTVYGMPKAAVERGAVESVLPVHEIAGRLQNLITGEDG
ncbi:MAG: chemotaxis-specific protein-glutamate methyltransferase CheB [Coriobacteriia bacterium]|nr:chemotaxis-specific protein-glutamate methyltransferase CheB [Coriobacteriia bacterium]